MNNHEYNLIRYTENVISAEVSQQISDTLPLPENIMSFTRGISVAVLLEYIVFFVLLYKYVFNLYTHCSSLIISCSCQASEIKE